jgi:arylsulfatase A-like enzyme
VRPELPPITGKSWLPLLTGEAEAIRSDQDYLAWEIFGNRALRQGDWKIRWQWKPFGTGDWELYDLAVDPGERSNLASQKPDKVTAMLELWGQYVLANNVIIPSRSAFETMEDQLPQRVPDDPGFPPLLNKRQFVPPPEMVKESAK